MEDTVDSLGAISEQLLNFSGELPFHSCINISSQSQNACLLIYRNLMLQKLERLLVAEKKIKRSTNSVRRQNLRKQLGSGSRQRTASQIIATKSAKETSWSQRNVFTIIFH